MGSVKLTAHLLSVPASMSHIMFPSLYGDILAGCPKITANHAVIFRKPARMSPSKVSRHCSDVGCGLVWSGFFRHGDSWCGLRGDLLGGGWLDGRWDGYE